MTLFDLQWQSPMMLLLLPLMLLPWLNRTQVRTIVWSKLIPIDPLSNLIGFIIKSLASLVFACLILVIAKPYLPEQTITQAGVGAEVILLVDRSRSMDEPFTSQDKAVAASRTVGKANSKRRVANNYLLEFVNKRPDDRFGFILFSNKALDLLPLTYNKESIRAAINASSLGKGLSETNIAKALIKAAEMYNKQEYRGSRTVLLVSDGGQELTANARQIISTLYKREKLTLYWLYMGASKDLTLNNQDQKVTWANTPDKKLHIFFKSLAIPYRVFKIDSLQHFSETIDTIDQQQNQPLIIEKTIPRKAKHTPFLWVAFIAMLLLITSQLYSVWGVRKTHGK